MKMMVKSIYFYMVYGVIKGGEGINEGWLGYYYSLEIWLYLLLI